MENNQEILKINNLGKNYPGVQALKDFDFSLYQSEVHCLVGENGAGKSTFIEILSGSIKPDYSEIYFDNKKYISLNPKQAIDLGIQTVHQENFLIESLTGAENIFIPNLKTNKLHFFDLKKCFIDANKLLESLNFHLDPTQLVENLTPVEKKVLSIVKALWHDTKILILDEPTASLGKEGTDILLKLVKEISSKGIGIIYISHYIEEVFKIADRITVLKDGSKVGTYNKNEIDKTTLINKMIGKDSESFYKKREYQYEKPVLKVKDYSKKGTIENISFSLSKGEIFGLGGMVGSGRTELARLIFGLDKKDSGKLLFEGKDITPNSPQQAINNNIGYLTENKKETGLFLDRQIRENITIVKLNKKKGFFLNLLEEKKDTENMVKKLRIQTPTINQFVRYLSGGNQQKVVLSKWLLVHFEIIILDEPTLGIDVGAKEEIYNLIRELSNEGKIIILISSDLEELVAISDTVGVIKEGKLTKILKGSNINKSSILTYAL